MGEHKLESESVDLVASVLKIMSGVSITMFPSCQCQEANLLGTLQNAALGEDTAQTKGGIRARLFKISMIKRARKKGGLAGGAVVKNLPANTGDEGLIPRSERSPRIRNDNPLQCSCLGNPMDRGDWQATVHGVTKSQTQLSTNTSKKEK